MRLFWFQDAYWVCSPPFSVDMRLEVIVSFVLLYVGLVR